MLEKISQPGSWVTCGCASTGGGEGIRGYSRKLAEQDASGLSALDGWLVLNTTETQAGHDPWCTLFARRCIGKYLFMLANWMDCAQEAEGLGCYRLQVAARHGREALLGAVEAVDPMFREQLEELEKS